MKVMLIILIRAIRKGNWTQEMREKPGLKGLEMIQLRNEMGW
jgi:hypothetical protein